LEYVADFGLGFDAAYAYECDVLTLMEGNFAIRRETFIDIGGMDENFSGCTYRHGTELAYRLLGSFGRRPRFLPTAGVRHRYAQGGQRAHGAKDTWGHLGASVGDYYFALRCLPSGRCLTHGFDRMWRASVNRHTIARPWLIPSMALREVIGLTIGCWRICRKPCSFVRALTDYTDCKPWHGSSFTSVKSNNEQAGGYRQAGAAR
jgi:hypothetical protein